MTYDILKALALPDKDFRSMLVRHVENKQVRDLFVVLHALGDSRVVYNEGNYRVWDEKEKKMIAVAGVYEIVAPFVSENYHEFEKLMRESSVGYGIGGILREMCINYLSHVGCECGKPFDDLYFEEDGRHLRCELFRKWAWAHLPPNMRVNFVPNMLSATIDHP